MLCFALPPLAYLSVTATAPTVFIVAAVVSSGLLLWRPRYLAIASVLTAALLLRHFAFLPPQNVPNEVNGPYRVLNVTAIGAIINHHGAWVNVPSAETMRPGDWIRVVGELTTPTNSDAFPLQTYLKGHNVTYTMAWPRVTILSRTTSLSTHITAAISDGPGAYQSLVPLLLFGTRTVLTRPFYDQMLALGAVHLVVISGLNLNLLAKLCRRALTLCKMPPRYAIILALVPVLSYVALLGYPVAAVRAGIMLTTYALSRTWGRRPLSSLVRLGLAMMVVMLWKPYAIFSLSFIFTFGASLIIALINHWQWRNPWTRRASIIIAVHVWTSLVAMHTNKTYAALSLPATVALTPVISGLYLLTVICWPIKPIVDLACTATLWLIAQLTRFSWPLPVEGVSLVTVQALSASALGLYIITTRWNFIMAKSPFLWKRR